MQDEQAERQRPGHAVQLDGPVEPAEHHLDGRWRDPAKIVNAMSVTDQSAVSWTGARHGHNGPSPVISILAPIHKAVVMSSTAPMR